MTEEIRKVSLVDLHNCARTLKAIRDNYKMEAAEWGSLVEAKRLVMIEIRLQHGEEAWKKVDRDNEV